MNATQEANKMNCVSIQSGEKLDEGTDKQEGKIE